MSRIYDITRTITPTLAVWPGAAPFSSEYLVRLAEGSSVNFMLMTLNTHTGTHADAPYHYTNSGEHPATLPLEKFIGSAHVATISRRNGGIVPADFDGHNLNGMQRLLIHTWVSDLPDDQWAEDFPYTTVELIDWLAAHGVVLMGVDMPSVDDFSSKTLDGHHRLLHHGIVNLETVILKNVPDGVYELVALPLKIDGVCASPVRAILREI
jgi:arylformamidase